MAPFNTADQRQCRMCANGGVVAAVDLGTAAVCSHYLNSPGEAVQRFPFRLGACSYCGLIQLQESPEIEWLRPPTKPLLFREPERHLDDLCQVIANQVSSRSGLVLGLSSNDQPVLDRLQRAGFTRTAVLDRSTDWNLSDPLDGMEAMQRLLTPDWASGIRARYGPVNVLCVRYLLEHAHDPAAFLAGCRTLMEPGGWVLFETPGCETELDRGDAGMLWEAHVSYFTSNSIRLGLSHHEFRCRWIGNYPYDQEDCLSVFGQFDEMSQRKLVSTNAGTTLLSQFAIARNRLSARLNAIADEVKRQGRKLALWGAGHRTVTLLELLPAIDIFDCVIDDDRAKQSLFLPGSGIPIVAAESLVARDIGLCIGMLNPEVMVRIASRHHDYTSRGGQFLTFTDLAAGQTGERS